MLERRRGFSRRVQVGLGLVLAGLLLALWAGTAGAQAFPPEARSEQGEDIRNLYLIVFAIAAVVFVVVEVGIVYLAIRYRRRSDELPPQIHGNRGLEVVWTLVPTVILVALFVLTFIVLDDVESAPDEDEPVEVIDVVARQWAWGFNYSVPAVATATAAISNDPDVVTLAVSDGASFRPFMTIRIDVEHLRVQEINGDTLTVTRAIDGTVVQDHAAGAVIDRIFNGTEFLQEERLGGRTPTPVVTVPVGKTVRFNLASLDVIHSFYTPQFLYKLDAMPGRVQSLWVKVTEPGLYQGQCAEFCGREHARMLFTVQALPLAEYEAWLAEKTPALEEAVAAVAGEEEGAAAERAADGDVAAIYAWLQTLPLLATIVPGQGTP